jgi:hypothetical protein
VILNVHLSVMLVFSILEDLCLPPDFKCTCISGVSVVHSGDLCIHCDFKCTCISGVSVVHSGGSVCTL